MTADGDRPADPPTPDGGAGFDSEFYHGPSPDPRSRSKFVWYEGDFVVGTIEDVNEYLGMDPDGRPYITPADMDEMDREFGID